MSAEYAAEKVAEAVGLLDARVGDLHEGGADGSWFFDVEIKGRNYEVSVIEFKGGGS